MTGEGISELGRAVVWRVALLCLLAWPSASAAAASAPGWSVWRLPVPSSALTASLSCSSSTACTAVATDYPFPSSDQDVLFAVRWNGRAWSRQRMAEPAPGTTILIGGISCPSSASCVAVGGSTAGDPPGPSAPVVERWNGTAWSIEPVPAPAGPGVSSRLIGVSCTSPTACTAVGESGSRTRPTTSLVERLDGATWSIEHAPGGPLIGVSCTSPLACSAIGNTARQPFAEGWDGSRWAIEPDPHPRPFGGPHGANLVSSVSCTSRDACTAVGYSAWGGTFNSVQITLAERWNGSRWSVQPTANPIRLDALNSVSCASGVACVAVGDYSNRAGDATLPLVQRWRRGRWSALQAPRRLSTGKFADATLLAVDCFTSGRCLAIGDAEGGPFAAQFASTAAPTAG